MSRFIDDDEALEDYDDLEELLEHAMTEPAREAHERQER